ncbi:hypothetical protein GGS20DRAFT_586110 [Poronia punctata]|nr:hypothetical protein GGS20DRAFT_586110 [Poronia punctata]
MIDPIARLMKRSCEEFYCYNVEGLLTLFWAFYLAFSVYYPERRTSSAAAKAIAIILPALLIAFLRIPSVRKSPKLFLALADISLAASLLLGSIFLIAIFAKYIHTRRNVRRDGIYDSWLIVRFAIAFFFIEAFQTLTLLSEIVKYKYNNDDMERPVAPDLSAARARGDFAEFVPGVSAGLLDTRTSQTPQENGAGVRVSAVTLDSSSEIQEGHRIETDSLGSSSKLESRDRADHGGESCRQ